MITQLPTRVSLVRDVAKALRQTILAGEWEHHIPSERQLCEQLHVSRETLRAALRELEEQGLVQRNARHRRKVLRPEGAASPHLAKVVILSPAPMEQWESRIILRIDRLRQYLVSTNTELIVRHGARFFSATRHHALEALVKEENASCWVLAGSTPEVQRWFADNKLPAIVMGPCFEDIAINSLDLDFRSLCRHAAGTLIGLGHERISLIVRDHESAGDHNSRVGFYEAFQKGKNTLEPLLLRYDGTILSLQRNLDRQFLSAHPPTALIGPARQIHTAVLHLAQRRIIASQNYAFISRDDDPILDSMIPSVARYCYNQTNVAHRLFLAISRIVANEHHVRRRLLLMPKFSSAASLVNRATIKKHA